MKVSLNTIKQFIDFELPNAEQVVERINQRLGVVEEVIELGEKYKDALIVRVVEREKHANADKLSVTKIDDGGVRENVERDEDGLVQVVCGANNVHAGMWAVWLPPQSIVPSSFDESDPFMLGARELRGVMSNGMLASNKELAIGTDHDGIVALTKRDVADGKELRSGASFAETFDLDDTIIDIENKMFTHRPDLFGQLGVAREISAIIKGLPGEGETDTRFVNPDWYWEHPEFSDANGVNLSVHNDAPEKVSRFMSVAMSDVSVGPSPFWLQAKLVAMGGKPVNNIVDITNYIMLITAQPTHAYDYDKLRGGMLGARMARAGEKITLLNGKTYELSEDDIVIVDGEGPIGLAGIMGGYDSEVTSETTRIAIEVATFDMYTLRKSSMRHGIFTDALTRFNKGQSRRQTDRVLARLLTLFSDLSGAAQASEVIDLVSEGDYLGRPLAGDVELAVGADFINNRLGTTLNADQIGHLLRRANFASATLDDDETVLQIAAPFWRTDIALPEDIVEEVGRLYGYDKLPRELPTRSMKAAPKNPRRELKQAIRESLSRAGANEVLTYSFVHENVITRAEQDVAQAYTLSNALSPDLQHYRLSVLPSLLDKVHMNIKAGHDEFALFEIGKSHGKDLIKDEQQLPVEPQIVEAVYANRKQSNGSAYYYMQQQVKRLCSDLGFTVYFKQRDPSIVSVKKVEALNMYDVSRSAMVVTQDGDPVGIVGELKQSVVREFKLPVSVAAASLMLDQLHEISGQSRQNYKALSKFPSVTQDISLKVASDISYSQVYDEVRGAIVDSEINFTIEPIAIYQPEDDASSKTITLRVVATSYAKTLNDQDVEKHLGLVAEAVKTNFDGERV